MKKIREVAELSLAHLINDIYAPVLMAIQPILIATLGYSFFEAALLPAMHSIISSLLQPVFGYLADRKGLKINVSISILLSGCGIAALGFLQDQFMMMMLCVALSAAGHASFHPGALCKVSAISSSGDRGRLTSLFVVGGNLGFALGPILAGIVLVSGGFPSLIWLIIPAIAGAIIIRIKKEPRECIIIKKTKSIRRRKLGASDSPLCWIFSSILGHLRSDDISPNLPRSGRISPPYRNNHGYHHAPGRSCWSDKWRNFIR